MLRLAVRALPASTVSASGGATRLRFAAFVERQAPSPVDDLANGTTTGKAPLAPREL